MAFLYRFIHPYTYPDQAINIYGDISLSLLSYIAGAYRILAIFLWKQTMQLAIRKDEKCISIKVTPKKIWISSESKHLNK